MLHLRCQEGEVMQARAGAVEEDDVMRIALALQKHAPQIERARWGDIFAQPEACRGVKLAHLADIRRQDLIVVEPQRRAAGMAGELRDHARHHRHGGAEFQQRSGRIDRMQRSTLMRDVRPRRRAAARFKEPLELVEVLLGEHTQAEARAADIAPFTQHEAVVTGLLDAAEVERVVFFRSQDQAYNPLIELPARRQVADGKNDMACPRNAKSRIEVRAWKDHAPAFRFVILINHAGWPAATEPVTGMPSTAREPQDRPPRMERYRGRAYRAGYPAASH